jgi:hypothetical protein
VLSIYTDGVDLDIPDNQNNLLFRTATFDNAEQDSGIPLISAQSLQIKIEMRSCIVGE